MGVHCPICNSHQAIVRNVTADGGPVTKNNPVLARVLACGHTLSGAKYQEYVKRCTEIDTARFNKEQSLKEAADQQKSALWSALTSEKEDA